MRYFPLFFCSLLLTLFSLAGSCVLVGRFLRGWLVPGSGYGAADVLIPLALGQVIVVCKVLMVRGFRLFLWPLVALLLACFMASSTVLIGRALFDVPGGVGLWELSALAMPLLALAMLHSRRYQEARALFAFRRHERQALANPGTVHRPQPPAFLNNLVERTPPGGHPRDRWIIGGLLVLSFAALVAKAWGPF